MNKDVTNAELQNETISLKGDLTVQHIAAIKAELAQAMARLDSLQLDISEATDVDISFLQLLCAAHRSALNLHKELALADQTQERIRKTLKDAGFVRHVGCSLGCSESCLWVME